MPNDKDNNNYLVVDVGNSGLTNLFISEFRAVITYKTKQKHKQT